MDEIDTCITKEPSSTQICQQTCRSNSSTSHLSEVLLIEFSSDAMNVLRFQKEFTLLGEHFQLKAMVRNFAGHFTCSLSDNDAEKLEYLDDLCETSCYFSNLELLHQRFPGGWFFGVFV